MPICRPVLRRGSKGAAVRELQDLLSVPIDGDFGSETYSTLRIVQRAHDLVPDGICGPMTWAALTSEPYCSELRGVDVSGFTSLTPEQWRTYFERDKYRFAIARLTTGRAPDEKGPGHLQNASGAGFTLLGGYGWLRGDQDAEEQAAVLIEACDRVENKIGIPISTWIDAEDRSSAEPWPRAAYARTCVDVFTILREKRPKTGTYIGPWFAKQIRHAAPQALATLAEGPLWISDYTPPVDLISEWSAWTIWQMKGGTFDLNVFDGDEESFRKSLL